MAYQQIQTSTFTERLMLRTDKTNYPLFKIHIEEYIAGKGISGYLDGSIPQPPIVTVSPGASAPTPTPIYSTTPSRDKWNYRNGVAKSIIITNIIDPIAVGLKQDGTAAEVWERLEQLCLAKSDAALSLAEEQFNNTRFTGTSRVELNEHIASLNAKAARLQSLGKTLPDKDLKNAIARSLPKTPEWFGISGSLYAALSSQDVIALIQTHAIHIGLPEEPTLGPGVNLNAYAASSGGETRRMCTNSNCKARDRTGHTIADCYWPGGGKEGQFPPNFGNRGQPQPNHSSPQANQVVYPGVSHHVLAARSDVIEDGEIIVKFIDGGDSTFSSPLDSAEKEGEETLHGAAADGSDDEDMPSLEPIGPLNLVMLDLLAPRAGSVNPFMLVMQDGPTSKAYALLDDTRETTMIQAFNNYRRRVEAATGCKIGRVHADSIFNSRAWNEYFATHNIIHTSTPYMSSSHTVDRDQGGQGIIDVENEEARKRSKCGFCVGKHSRVDCNTN